MDNDKSFLKNIKPVDIRFESPTFIDPLTSLFNRYYLDQFLPQEIQKSTLGNYPFTVLMIDLDNFKKINDDYGHLSGDKILKDVSGAIKKSLRQTDMVIRYAGDEFIVLLPGAGREKARSICENIIGAIQAAPFTDGKKHEFRLTLSIGYVVYPEDTREQIKLIDMADKALYLSKKRGRNRYSSAKEVTMEEASSLIAMDSFPCPKFIDQEKAMESLKLLYDKVVKTNSLEAVFISGPSGIGKSRILNEMAMIFKDSATLIRCSASLPNMKDPYHIFAKGIDAYVETMAADNPQLADILSNVTQDELSEAGLIVPSLRALVKKPSESKAGDKKRGFLLFKAFIDLLSRLVGAPPLLMIFDDVEWADEASLEILRYLIMRENNKNIFIVCAFTEEAIIEKTGGAGLRGLLKDIGRLSNVTNIKVADLSLKDTAEMVDAIFPGIGRSKNFVDLIYDAAKGNPSFIEEVLKSLVENGFIFYQDGSWQVKKGMTARDIPDSMEEIIKRRLRSLDDETKETILQAAVIGQDFQLGILKKMGDKNEGFLSELVGRAKSMRLVNESGKTGKFNFINKDIQDILYSELSEDRRNKLHYKIANILAGEHKDNLYDVAGEASFHYSHAPRQEKAEESGRELLKLTTELFDPVEIAEYIKQMAQDILSRKGKVNIELSKKVMAEASKFVLFFQGAIKKFRLYPSESSVRRDTLKQALQYLNTIFNEAGSLIITEVEKNLVINGKRVFFSDQRSSYAEDLLAIMMEHGIKTIALKKGVREDEMSVFISQLSESPKDAVDKGGWAAIIEKDKLEHIGIDEVRFVSVDEYARGQQGTKKLEDLMFMDFLMGKVDRQEIDRAKIVNAIKKDPEEIAHAMMDLANMSTAKDKTTDEAKVISDAMMKIGSEILGEDSKGLGQEDVLAKVILALEPNLRNKVFRYFLAESGKEQEKAGSDIMRSVPDDLILKMIRDEYKNNMDNPLIAKEFIDGVLPHEARRKELLAKIEPELSALGINKKELSFVVGQTNWKDLPMDRRIEMLLRLPDDYYSEPVLNKIKGVLEELDSAGKKEGLKNTISRFLIKAKKVNAAAHKELLGTIIDFVKGPFVSMTESYLQKTGRIDAISGMLEDEKNPAIFAYLLDITKQIIDGFLDSYVDPKDIILKKVKSAARKIFFINQLFYSLLKWFKTEEEGDPQIRASIKDSILEISGTSFLQMLAYSMIDETAKIKYDMQDIYLIVKDKFVDTLINLAVSKNLNLNDPFREFLIRKKFAGLLVMLKDVSLGRLNKVLSDMTGEPSVQMIELAGYFKDEGLVDWLSPFAHHINPATRAAAIQALGDIGDEKSVKILAEVVDREKDAGIKNMANVRLQRLMKRNPPRQ